jgi:hypothetical protein
MSSYHYSFIFSHRFHCLGFLPQISQIYTEVRLPSRGCTCLRSALPLARARSAPTKQEVPPEISRFCEFCVFCGRHFAVAEARIPPLLSSAPNKSVSICEICGRTSPARVKSVGGLLFAWLVHLRQVHPLKTASVKIREICGRLFSARSFCEFCGFRGRFYSARSAIRGKPFHARILTRNSKGR